MDAAIRLENLTTGYKGRPVTAGIDAELRPGRLICLLGPNGAGKSTLLKTLCTFIPPLSGRIYIYGEPLERIKARELARMIGVVLTERPAGVNMTVEELVAMGRSPYTSLFGGLRRDDRRAVDRAIDLVGIAPLRLRAVHSLSDGERQKALIAKTLAQQTGIILLDEPTAFLDYPSKADMLLLLCRLAREEDKTVFMSTHDLELALQVADEVWLLDRDHGLRIGTPAALAADGSLAEYFRRPGLDFDSDTCSFRIVRD